MRYALIGCGRIAPSHIKAAKENSLDIVALCDTDISKAKELAARFCLDETGVSFFSDYKEAIDSAKPDIVAVATESGMHAPIALYAIEKGVATVIEKPIAMCTEDALAIVKKAEEKGVFVCTCMQNRFNEAVCKLKKALDDGRFGRISHASLTVRWHREKSYYDQADWRGKWESDGGALMNQCIHGLDLLRWLMGDEIESVSAMTDRRFHPYIEAEDIGVAIIKFKNGALATVEGSVNVYPNDREVSICVFGENATAKIGGKSANKIEIWDLSDEKDRGALVEEKTESIYGNGHTPLYADLICALKGGGKIKVDARAGMRALELVLAIYRSAAEGRVVTLPLEPTASADFINRFNK